MRPGLAAGDQRIMIENNKHKHQLTEGFPSSLTPDQMAEAVRLYKEMLNQDARSTTSQGSHHSRFSVFDKIDQGERRMPADQKDVERTWTMRIKEIRDTIHAEEQAKLEETVWNRV